MAADDDIIVEVRHKGQTIMVREAETSGSYDVLTDGQVRHPNCTAEDVMRALGDYLHDEGEAKIVNCDIELRDALADMVRLFDDMSRHVAKMALQDYQLFNEAPSKARVALAKARAGDT